MFESFIKLMDSVEKSKKSDKNIYRLGEPVCYVCGEEVETEEGQYGCGNCQRRTYDRKK